MQKLLAASLLLLISFLAPAQTTNDNIANRIELFPDSEPVFSSTHKATVEWSCINKALTKSCLVYHNDQWYYFKPTHTARQYLNITNQDCKNFKGVQVVIMEGDPCKAETYRLIHCTSLTDQNDTFIAFDSLKPGTEYLVLIDGFLGDQCHFNIQFSSWPSGLDHQRKSLDTLSLVAEQTGQKVLLHWQADQQLLDELDHFEVTRQQTTESKAQKLATVSIVTNALGRRNETYTYADSLTYAGTYAYRIIGISRENADRLLLDEMKITYYPKPEQLNSERKIIQFLLNFSLPGEVEVIVTDALTGKSLFGFTVQNGQHTTIPIDITAYILSGKRFFRIKAIHSKTRAVKSQTYTLNEEGVWISVSK